MGGYGRQELAPSSDLDLVLLHADDRDVDEFAARLWYPLWDGPHRLDHAVRAESEILASAAADLKVHLGLLDLRHLAGDRALTERVRSAVLAHWRERAPELVPALMTLVEQRASRCGSLGHDAIPDLKDSSGGLRDIACLQALVLTWLVDAPHAELDRARQDLLDVRDGLHQITGHAGDRIEPEHWALLAPVLGLADAEAVQRLVRSTGRRVEHMSRLMWGRARAALPGQGAGRSARLEWIERGVAVAGGEIVLHRSADPVADPSLLLRVAAEAAEQDLPINPATATRLTRDCRTLPAPWDADMRRLFLRLLASGPGLRATWATLEDSGALEAILPEWEGVRLLPHASTIHRYTVDRHIIETVVEAAGLIRRVDRPDLLLVGALLHDIGKAETTDHSVAGESVARTVALRMGFPPADADTVAALVRWHLLLATTATTRDLEDPATIAYVVERVGDVATLDLLEMLAQADAKATAPQAWTAWRARLVAELAARARAVLSGDGDPAASRHPEPKPITVPPEVAAGGTHVGVENTSTGARVMVVAPDRVGHLLAVAGALLTLRVSVLTARSWVQDGYGVSEWTLNGPVNAAVLSQRIAAVADGSMDPDRYVEPLPPGPPPVCTLGEDLSDDATVIEVRTGDRAGLLYLVFGALAGLGLSVRSAHLSTLGPQAIDVFYVQRPGVGRLGHSEAAAALAAVDAAVRSSPRALD